MLMQKKGRMRRELKLNTAKKEKKKHGDCPDGGGGGREWGVGGLSALDPLFLIKNKGGGGAAVTLWPSENMAELATLVLDN